MQNPFKHLRWCAFVYPVNDFKLLTVYAKHSLLDVWRGSECACVQIAPGNVLCNNSKHLMGYFEFINSASIICLPLNISENLHWQLVALIFINSIQYPHTLKNNIYLSNKREPPPFFCLYTNTWPRSGPFCWQNPCSGYNSGTDLVVTLEYIFFQLCSNIEQIS